MRTRDAMTHRGPDGSGLWTSKDQRVGLGHRRLAIIDLSAAGEQPMATEDGAFVVVFNGEIYNYRELRRELETAGYRFRSQTDTEVLLHLYARMGSEMVGPLRGMFAFAIWDSRKGGLFLARDPFGIKPLYYTQTGGVFRFASQVKALLAGRGFPVSSDPAGHVGFFLWGSLPDPYTLYRQIHAVPAGATVWVDANGAQAPRTYFRIADLFLSDSARAVTSAAEMSERLEEALRDTVRKHMVADVEVGVFLSAGLDSATVTALAAEEGRSKLRTITLAFKELKGTEYDESLLARKVAQRYDTHHLLRWVEEDEFHRDMGMLCERMDQPTLDGVNTYFVSKAAAESGIKVALSGLGGDELFEGYTGFREIPRLVRLISPFGAIPGFGKAFRWLTQRWFGLWTSPKYSSLFEFGATYAGAYLLRRALFLHWELDRVLDPKLVAEGWEELRTLQCLNQTICGLRGSRLKLTVLEQSWFMRNQLLRDADWAGMAHSIEIRVPMVDVELQRKLAPLVMSAHPPSKAHMARTPHLSLPDAILNRRKTGFNIPVQQWFQPSQAGGAERGLRSWAKKVYVAQTRHSPSSNAPSPSLAPRDSNDSDPLGRLSPWVQARGTDPKLSQSG